MQKINSGKGPLTAQNDYIDINNIFSELKPNPVTTNENGTNNAVSATAARWIVYFSAETDDRDRLEKYEEELEDYCESFNDDSRYIDVYVIGSTAYSRGLSN